jgi:branched-chain amino acid transport system substrate-binding protein
MAVAVLAALSVAAPASAEPVKIGVLSVLSGFGAAGGIAMKQAVELAAAQINAKGGIGGNPIQLVIYDSEFKPDIAVRLAKRLIEADHVIAIVGPLSSPEALALKPMSNQAQIPILSPGSARAIVDPPAKWLFKASADDHIVIARLLAYLKEKGLVRLALISTQDGYGDGGRRELLAQAPAFGVTIVFDERFGMNDADVTPTLAKIKNSDAQAVVSWSSGRAMSTSLLNYRQLGLGLPYFIGHQGLGAYFVKSVGAQNAEGVMTAGLKLEGAAQLPDSDPQKQAMLSFLGGYKAKYGNIDNVVFGAPAFDAVNIIANCIGKTGVDAAKIRDCIEQTHGYVGVAATYDYSPADHGGFGPKTLAVYRVEHGVWTIVE